MDPRVETRRIARLQAAVWWIGASIAILGGAALVGWASHIAILKTVLPGLAAMKANTALAFVLAAVPLVLRGDRGARRPALARGCAALVSLIGALTLAEYALGWDLHIDQWLFRDAADAPDAGYPGRMAPMTPVGLVMLGLAELAPDRAGAAAAGQWLAVAVGFLGVLNFVGYAYRFQGLSHLYSPALAYTEMALHTAGAFVAASAALLCAQPDRGMMAVVTSG